MVYPFVLSVQKKNLLIITRSCENLTSSESRANTGWKQRIPKSKVGEETKRESKPTNGIKVKNQTIRVLRLIKSK